MAVNCMRWIGERIQQVEALRIADAIELRRLRNR
jgi:hypothetical protein